MSIADTASHRRGCTCDDCLLENSVRDSSISHAVRYCSDGKLTGVFDERHYTICSLLLSGAGQPVEFLSDPESYLTVLADERTHELTLAKELIERLSRYRDRKSQALAEEGTLDLCLPVGDGATHPQLD